MLIFPHPDDETVFGAGILLAYKRAGWRTVVVTLTQGEAGNHYTDKKETRVGELKKACAKLKVDHLEVGDFGDAKLRYRNTWKKWIRGKISLYSPDLTVTYDHSGFTGHPDHITVSLDSLDWPGKIWWISFFHKEHTHKIKLGLKDWLLKIYLMNFVYQSQKLPLLMPWVEWYYEVDKSQKYSHKFVDFRI